MNEPIKLDPNTVDFTKFQLKKVGRGVKLVYDKNPFRIQTSSLYSPFPVKSVKKDWSRFQEYSIDCSLNQSQGTNAQAFREFIEKLDETIQNLVKNNLHLFTNCTSDFVYNPILRVNGTYPKLMKLQFKRDDLGNFTTFVFNEDKSKVVVTENNINEHFQKGKVFKCIIENSKLWCYNGKVGSIWNMHQVRFSSRQENTQSGSQEQTNTQNKMNFSRVLMLD